MYSIHEKRVRRRKVSAVHILLSAIMSGGLGKFGYAPAYGGDMGNPVYSPKRKKFKGWQRQAREAK